VNQALVVSFAPSAADTDAALAAAARGGQLEAFAILFERYRGPLVRYLGRHTGDAGLAADLAQEAFLAAYRDLASLAEDRSFAAWLFGIARNRARMHWRRQRLRRVASLDWLALRSPASINPLSVAGPEDAATARDLVQRALDALSPSLRDALLLHRLVGFDSAEVAAVLGISVEAARKRIYRADGAFRDCYASLSGGGDARGTV